MKIKRYTVKDMAEAMLKIKSELGNEAVILHTRKVKEPGFWGFFGKSMLEVVAAVDEEKERQAAMAKALEIKKILVDRESHEKSEVKEISEKQSNQELEKMNRDIQYLKDMIQTLIDDRKENGLIEPTQQETPSFDWGYKGKRNNRVDTLDHRKDEEKRSLPVQRTSDEDERHETLLKLLLENDVNESHINYFGDALKHLDLTTPHAIKQSLTKVIDEKLGKVFTIEKDYAPQKIFFFVGPTGVGKTTTLAKLAARLSLIENKRIGLITADTFRIAAVDQLRTYCEILGVPLSVIYEADEIKSAIKKYKQCDYILVDTAGRSHKSDDMPRDIKSLLQAAGQSEIFLVLSATTGYKDLKGIIQSYDFIKDYKVIITKLDEASAIGNVLNITMLTNKPLTYFTIGQSVPDDIEVANTERIVNAIMGDA